MKVPFIDLKRESDLIKNEVIQKIVQVLEAGEYSYGRETQIFEQKFADFTSCRFCTAVSSGTEALIIALKALGIGKGDEVITTPLTFVATAEAIVNVGAKPVFVDIDRLSMNLAPDLVREKINRKTKAILPVHIFGVCAEMQDFRKIARERGLFLIEDAAHAIGSRYHGQPAGSLGDIGCFSLYPSKTLGAYGNAGAIVTSNEALAKRIKMISNHGRGKDKYLHEEIGLTGTINNLQAAVLNVKMKALPERIARKKQIVRQYNQSFRDLPVQLQTVPADSNPSFYVYSLRAKPRQKLIKFLNNKGVGTGIYYPLPLHLQPSLKFLGYQKGDFPVAEEAADQVFSLPLFPEMTDGEVERVIKEVKSFFGN